MWLSRCSRPPLLLLHVVEPGADARHHLVVSRQHLDRAAQPALGIGEPHGARFGALFGREPGAVVAPDAGALLALGGLPIAGVDVAGAPAILGHEPGRVPGVERGDEIAAMAPQRHGEAALFPARLV